jgi:hypothetical protein
MSERQGGGEYQPRQDKESILHENRLERFSKRYHRFLKVLFVAWNVAYLDHEDLLLAAERMPQIISAKMSEDEAKKTAEGLLEKYQEKMDKGESLPVDLATLYLEQERQLGGVSEADTAKARAHFDALVEAAKRQQAGGWSEPETLGWILKQQGDYNDGYNQLTDLLNSGVGECEARAKFIAAMVQAVFPEYVKNSQMKVEIFRGKVNESGVIQPGHVRVIIDLTAEGKGVIVLEGDAPHHEMNPTDIAKHQEIGGREVTAMAVKSFAVKTGLTTWGVEDEPNKKLIKKATREDLKKVAELKDPIGQVSSLLHSALVDNSTSSYPEGIATYGDGRETMNIDPHPIGKSYALSRENFGNTIELRLVHNKPKLTLDNLDQAYTSGIIDLERFDTFDEQALDVLLTQRQEQMRVSTLANLATNGSTPQMKRVTERINARYQPIAINSKQGIHRSIFREHGPIAWVLHGDQLPSIFDIPTSSMQIKGITEIPAEIAGIAWTKDSYLDLQLAIVDLDNNDIEGGMALTRALQKGLTHISIEGGGIGDQFINGVDFRWMNKMQSLNLKNVSTGSLAGLEVDQLSWSRNMGFQAGALANARAHDTVLRFNGNGADKPSKNPKDALEFDGGIFSSNGEGTGQQMGDYFITDTLALQVAKNQRVTIEAAAFSNMHFDVLSLSSDILLREDALVGARIDTLVINIGQTAPADMIKPELRAINTKPLENIRRVVIIRKSNTLLDKGDQALLKSTPPLTNEELTAFRKDLDAEQLGLFNARLNAKAPIFVVVDQVYQSLIEKYGSQQAIPDTALLASANIISN